MVITFLAMGMLTVPSPAQESSPTEHEIEIHASPTLLPIGMVCRVEMRPKATGLWASSSVAYEGEVTEVAGDGLGLAVSRVQGRNDVALPPVLKAVPSVSRLFKSSGTAVIAPPKGKENVRLHARDILAIRVTRLPEPNEGGVDPVSHEEAEATDAKFRPVTIFADPSIVPEGAVCRVELHPTRSKDREIEGIEHETYVTYSGAWSPKGLLVGAAYPPPERAIMVRPVPSPELEGRSGAKFMATGLTVNPAADAKEVRLSIREIRSITIVTLPEEAAPNRR